MNDSR